MGRKKSSYRREEAEGRIPEVARRLALEAVDFVIALERYPLDSREVEHRLWALSGLTGHLNRLCHVVWKSEGLKRAATKGVA